MENICVIGLGYIGLPTAAVFARAGCSVLGVDINSNIVSTLNQGLVHIEEAGLNDIVSKAVQSGKLRAATKPASSDVYIIAVPTPIHEDFSANVDAVVSAAQSILPYLEKGNIVIVESTIPPGTIQHVIAPIFEKAGWDPGNNDIYLSYCPERVLPGKILYELINNTRIVGGYTREAALEAAEIYKLVVKGAVIETGAPAAEMAKLMENTFRDVNIALANELAKISKALNVNAHEVIELANKHPRVNIHQPGPGVGGHCLAVDPYFIVEKAADQAQLIKLAREINQSMPSFVARHVEFLVSELRRPKVALLGLAYKGNSDDCRESPAIKVYRLLKELKGLQISVYEPFVNQEKVNINLVQLKEALSDAHLAVVLTDHKEFKQLDSRIFIENMKTPVIFDTKNCINIKNDEVKIYKIGDLNGIETINESFAHSKPIKKNISLKYTINEKKVNNIYK
ncbi:nucleotide sugar dehydrogenase [Scopulibacillus cellulosilyticus]|uniref:Nucleotide sugar dehydrogenase n=1 Tax=Scopulibacillus cellulosilyticus TaxID=2665665 RepID=A0ABW2PZD3_9BACL